MRLLWAVAVDLGLFAYDAFRAFTTMFSQSDSAPLTLSAPKTYPEIPERTAYHAITPELAPYEVMVPSFPDIQKNTVMYTSSVRTPLLTSPGQDEGGVTATLPYGSMVMVLESKAPYARVASGAHEGWVYIDDLTDRAANVYPQFILAEENLAEDVNTERVRAIIDDEFGAGDLSLPLQAEEYVLYRLARKNIRIAWPPVRPRSPGTWHNILAPVASLAISSNPKPGAIMELSYGERVSPKGHVAYVEAVFPDNSIQISEANWPENGMYNERILVADEWRALNPHFIIV